MFFAFNGTRNILMKTKILCKKIDSLSIKTLKKYKYVVQEISFKDNCEEITIFRTKDINQQDLCKSKAILSSQKFWADPNKEIHWTRSDECLGVKWYFYKNMNEILKEYFTFLLKKGKLYGNYQ